MTASRQRRTHRPGTRSVCAILLAVLAAGVAGCAEGTEDEAGPPAEAEPATFVAVDIAYDDAPATLPPGEQTLELVNQGELPHTVTIEELGDLVVVETQGGETGTGQVELEAGSYTYYCSVPGHRAAGMEGTLEVAADTG